MTIRFKTCSARGLILVLLTNVIFEEFFISLLHFPAAWRYINDGLLLILVLYAAQKGIRRFLASGCGAVIGVLLLFCMSLCMGVVLNGFSLLLFLWGCRNIFRFFAFFFACVVLLGQEDVRKILDFFCRLQVLNFALCLIEYFMFSKRGDFLGGMFGVDKGCNGYLNTYLCAVTAYRLSGYFGKSASWKQLIPTLLMTMIVAALAELKFVFIELLLIVGIALFCFYSGKKMVLTLLGALAAIYIGMRLMEQIYPAHYQILTKMSDFLSYINADDRGYSISRFNAFTEINQLFFGSDMAKKLFGLGFGNCEYSSFSFLTSRFYLLNGRYNYRWFAHQMIYLETGMVGFILFVGILAAIIVCVLRRWKAFAAHRDIACFSLMIGILAIANLWYNASIRNESAYLLFFCLAAGPVFIRTNCVMGGVEPHGAIDAIHRDSRVQRRKIPDGLPAIRGHTDLHGF